MRGAKVFLFLIISVSSASGIAVGQSYVDTLDLVPLPPDSVYVERSGGNILIRWYPPHDSVATSIGSTDFTYWFANHDTNVISKVTFSGYYTGDAKIDRTIKVEKLRTDRDTVGYESSIMLGISTDDEYNTYLNSINIGANYTPGDPIPIALYGQEPPYDTLNLGINMHFGPGVLDTIFGGGPPFFLVDLQDFEGFHVWRGLSEYPSDMKIIVDLSKEDAFIGVDFDSIYFEEFPKRNAQGRKYFEWSDENVFVGFTYYYIVTCYDRGYFKGFFLHNKWDSYICEDPDPDYEQVYGPPDGPIECIDEAFAITMTVDTQPNMAKIYAVPNPYRTGTSASTSPFYHNYPDKKVKFFNVPREASIKIYTVSGDLVWEKHQVDPTGQSGILSWDTKNKNGLEVGSGVYIFKIENTNNGDYMYGRLVVIR